MTIINEAPDLVCDSSAADRPVLYPEDGSPTTLRGLPLLDAVIDHIGAHPETSDPGIWAKETPSGTTLCVAGHAVVAAGYELDYEEPVGDPERYAFTCHIPGAEHPHENIDDVAARLFGCSDLRLDDEDEDDFFAIEVWVSAELFSASNSLDDIRRIRDEIAGRVGQPLRYTTSAP